MNAWKLGFSFGGVGALLGLWAASGAGITSLQPVWALSGGAWFAIFGAILGGVADVVQAIQKKT